MATDPTPAVRWAHDDRVLDHLRSVWDEPRPFTPPPRVWRDWVLVGVLVPLTVLEGLLRPDLPSRVAWVIVVAALVPTLLWRRTRPLLMVVIVVATTSLTSLLTGSAAQLNTMAFVLILPYSLFRWGSRRDCIIGFAVLLVMAAVTTVTRYTGPGDAIGGFAVLFASLTLGEAFRYRAGARIRELDQIKLLEREGLARDLHDTVAHHVSAIAIRAQAGLATAASHPDAATDALRVIEAEASRTLAEMRSMVRVLRRNDPPELAPGPRISDLEQLRDLDRGGPFVDVELIGDVDTVPAPVATGIYRLAQESVTNARRHARHATRIEVRVVADDRWVRLRVSDDGELHRTRTGPPSGYGLVGMIERANLLGGTCEAGPGPDRGWTVSVVLPKTGTP